MVQFACLAERMEIPKGILMYSVFAIQSKLFLPFQNTSLFLPFNKGILYYPFKISLDMPYLVRLALSF